LNDTLRLVAVLGKLMLPPMMATILDDVNLSMNTFGFPQLQSSNTIDALQT
jgi:hypothetical protein